LLSPTAVRELSGDVATPAASKPNRSLTIAVALGLTVVTVLTFFGVWKNQFVNFDDQLYVYQNPFVLRGLGWPTIKSAFTHPPACNWHPLTWLSHAADCQFYGLNPAGHHVTNLIFHTAN